ncbi:MAG: MerC domain-containing protein [Flavobacteriales bacterium]|jgi:hypothetical protein|nr:MerC domain-containing protein [Flavobacteriales bacterium]
MPAPHTRSADLLGLVNTAICLVHCLALPVLVSLGGAFFAHPATSWAFVLLAVSAVWLATRRSADRRVAALLWGAAAVFGAGLLLEPVWPWMHEVGIMGSVLLIVGHVLNLRGRLPVPAHSRA